MIVVATYFDRFDSCVRRLSEFTNICPTLLTTGTTLHVVLSLQILTQFLCSNVSTYPLFTSLIWVCENVNIVLDILSEKVKY